MGDQRDSGYSANVESYLVVGQSRFRLARTNGITLTLAEDCQLPAGLLAEMHISVDGDPWVRTIQLPNGVAPGQRKVRYREVAPF